MGVLSSASVRPCPKVLETVANGVIAAASAALPRNDLLELDIRIILVLMIGFVVNYWLNMLMATVGVE